MALRLPARPVMPAWEAAVLVAGVGLAMSAGWLVAHPGGVRVALVGAAALGTLGLGVLAPRALLYVLIPWLAVLGLVRRVVAQPTAGSSIDPLLVIGPVIIVFAFLLAVRSGALARPSLLGKAVGALALLSVVEAFNPLQGSLRTGLAGLAFLLVPLLMFWVGRALCDDATLGRVGALVGGLAVVAALYGLYQNFSHFPSWDLTWIRTAGYAALSVGGTVRAFSSFSSAQEYALFVAMGMGAWFARRAGPVRTPLTVAALGLCGVALFYESSRSVLIVVLLAAGLVVAARLKVPVGVGALVGVLFAGALLVLAAHLSAGAPTRATSSELAAHQLQGLGDPLGATSSTLRQHLSLGGRGLRSALTDPLGLGTGSVTIAASKFGGSSAGTELDPSNVAVAFGIPGVLAFVMVLGAGFLQAYRVAVRRQDAVSRVALFFLAVTVFQWLNGGLYSVAALVWLVLGWVDAASARPPAAEAGSPDAEPDVLALAGARP
ncbi:MAG TPA: hypothetical protein VFW71_13360 [Actinomycetota bacterium]|nr:hypothetical protein [Actinomycetota bacterium]